MLLLSGSYNTTLNLPLLTHNTGVFVDGVGQCKHHVKINAVDTEHALPPLKTFISFVWSSVLTVAIHNHADIMDDPINYSPASYRKAAYRQYILKEHGHLGRGNRRIIPSCVVRCVRDKYPAPDGLYLGFRVYLFTYLFIIYPPIDYIINLFLTHCNNTCY